MILSCHDLTAGYDANIALEHVSFQAEPGDYICVVGENGSGKSTLLKSILGLIPLKNGTVSFGPQVQHKRIGYLPQKIAVQKDFPASVYEVVLSGCLNRRGLRPFYNKTDKMLASENMERLGINNLRKRSFGTLSGGQQQRALLARALCATDKLLLLDEPVTGLDPLVTENLYQLIANLNRELGLTVLMVSHDIASAVRYGNKILHLKQSALFFGNTQDYLNTDLCKQFLKCL